MKAKSTTKNVENVGLKMANPVPEYESKIKEPNPLVEILIPLVYEV